MVDTAKEIPLGMRELHPNPGTYVAQCLKEQGVEVAFGIHGGHVWQIISEMSNAGIKIITVHHEESAVYAAEAYSKVTNKPGVAIGTAGPGMLNMVSPTQQAMLSCSPVILLLGGSAAISDGTYHLQMASALKSMDGITKWVKRMTTPQQIKHLITKAFKDAQAYPKGPIALEFSIGRTPIPAVPGPGDHIYYTEQWRGEETSKPIPVGGAPELVEMAVKRVYEAKKPVIFAADGVHWSGAWNELVEFAELAQIPTSSRRLGRGSMPEVHPLYVSTSVARRSLGESDLLLVMGMKVGGFDDMGVGWPECIQINESPEHIWTFLKTAVAIVGSPKVVLRQMIDYIKANNLKPPAGRVEWVRQLQEAHKANLARLQARAEKYKDSKPVHWGYLGKVLGDIVEKRYGGMNRIMVDGFTISGFAPQFIKARYSGQQMDSSEQGGVGHGIGMAIGAALADPESKKHPVVALMGDSGVGLAGFDIETAARYHLPIVYLVTNNDGWLTAIKNLIHGKDWTGMGPQDREYGQAFLPDIRYDKMFEETGCHGEWVTEPDQIRDALERAFTAAEGGKPAVVNVKMDNRVAHHILWGAGLRGITVQIPWEGISKAEKALRRKYWDFDWDAAGIPELPIHEDIWEPLTDEEIEP
ncbi:thiamine pyrophosphate-binding protein [Chloroflexota bacterium]